MQRDITRRVHRSPLSSRDYGRTQIDHNSTKDDGGFSASRCHPGGSAAVGPQASNSLAVQCLPRNNHIPRKTVMTVPLSECSGEMPHRDLLLPIPQTPRTNPIPLLQLAQSAEITDSAFRFLTGMLLSPDLEPGKQWTLNEIAAATGATNHSCRRHVGALAEAGLLASRRTVLYVDGEPRDLNVYWPAVTR